MRVFKAYGKIIFRNLPSFMVYIIVFVFFASLLSSNSGTSHEGFFEVKNRVMIVNEDGSTPLTEGLVTYLSEKCQIVPMALDQEGKADSLFYEESEYILTIPEGFTNELLSGNSDAMLEKLTIEGSPADIKTDLLIEKYLKTFELYRKSMGISLDDTSALSEIKELIAKDLSKQTNMVWVGVEEVESVTKASYFFKYIPYSLMSIMILGVSIGMQVFNQADVKRRMQCAPISATKVNLFVFLGNICFAFAVWVILMIVCLLQSGAILSDMRTILMIINSLVFTFTALSLAFLTAQFIKGPAAQHSVANVLALGTSFISGVFVPLEFLGESVKHIASFTPVYWYVSGVEYIITLTSFEWNDMKTVYFSMLIQIAFGAAFLTVALVLGRQRKRREV